MTPESSLHIGFIGHYHKWKVGLGQSHLGSNTCIYGVGGAGPFLAYGKDVHVSQVETTHLVESRMDQYWLLFPRVV